MSSTRPLAATQSQPRIWIAFAAVLSLVATMLAWQFASSTEAKAAPITESFAGATPSSAAWIRLGDACLTDAASGAWQCVRDADPAASNTSRGYGTPAAGNNGTGFLQLTDNRINTNGGAVYNTPIAASQGLAIEFTQYQYGPTRNRPDRRPADGIGFFLVDGSVNLTATGPIGGSLGYAYRHGTAPAPGIAGGYVGVGLDTFGNYTNTGHVGGTNCTVDPDEPDNLYGGAGWNTLVNTNARFTNNISVRGPGSGSTGYCLLDRVKLDTIGANGSVADTFSPHVPGSWGTKSLWAGDLTTIPTQAAVQGAGRKIRVHVSPATTAAPNPTVRVAISYDGTTFEQVLSTVIPQALPSTFKFGFSASTGNNTASHLIGDLSIMTPPSANPSTQTHDQGQSASFDLTTLTVAGDGAITTRQLLDGAGNPVASLVVPGQGTWAQTGNTVTFTPLPSFSGPVTPVTYRVTDANGLQATEQLNVIYRPETGDLQKTVEPGATASFPQAELGVAPGSGTISGDGTTPAYQLVHPVSGALVSSYAAANGTWSINSSTGAAQYVANVGYRGPVDPIDYRITDTNGEQATGTLSIIMGPGAENETKNGNLGDPVSFDPIGDLTQAGSDPTLTITLVTPDSGSPNTKTVPGQGVWTLVPGTGVITFTPEAGFTGNPTPIDYRVTDGNTLSATGTLTVLYNSPPVAGDQTVRVNPGQPATLNPVIAPGTDPNLTVSLDGSDPGDPTTKTVPGQGVWTVVPGTGVATFTPEPGFTGAPTPITYTVTDGNGLTDQGTLTVLVNEPPVAKDQAKTTPPGTPVTFDPIADLVTPGTSTDLTVTLIDPATGQPATGSSVTVPGEGVWTVDLVTGKITFTPEDGFSGEATIGYRVTDGNTLFDEATLTVTVTASADSGDDGDDTSGTDETDGTDDEETGDESGSGGEDRLPQTGANVTAITVGALGMLMLGAGLVVITRRRFQS